MKRGEVTAHEEKWIIIFIIISEIILLHSLNTMSSFRVVICLHSSITFSFLSSGKWKNKSLMISFPCRWTVVKQVLYTDWLRTLSMTAWSQQLGMLLFILFCINLLKCVFVAVKCLFATALDFDLIWFFCYFHWLMGHQCCICGQEFVGWWSSDQAWNLGHISYIFYYLFIIFILHLFIVSIYSHH